MNKYFYISYILALGFASNCNAMDKPLPLEYFQELEKSAQSGSKKARKELESHSHYATKNVPAINMHDRTEWGENSQDDLAIRAIFSRWVPKGEAEYELAQSFGGASPDRAVPLIHFELLEKAALAGSKKARKDLESHSHYATKNVPAQNRFDKVEWGENSQDDLAIRSIFSRWVPKPKTEEQVKTASPTLTSIGKSEKERKPENKKTENVSPELSISDEKAQSKMPMNKNASTQNWHFKNAFDLYQKGSYKAAIMVLLPIFAEKYNVIGEDPLLEDCYALSYNCHRQQAESLTGKEKLVEMIRTALALDYYYRASALKDIKEMAGKEALIIYIEALELAKSLGDNKAITILTATLTTYARDVDERIKLGQRVLLSRAELQHWI